MASDLIGKPEGEGSDGGDERVETVMPTAGEIISTITDRMPAELLESNWPKWLGEEPASLEELKARLRTSTRDLDTQKAGKPPPPPKLRKPPKTPKDDGQSSLF